MLRKMMRRWTGTNGKKRFTRRVAQYLRTHFGEVLGDDDALLDRPDAIDILHEKYFGKK